MIGYLKGRVLEHSEGRMLLGVGGADSLVGYGLTVPQSPSYVGILPGETLELFIYTHVLEDTLDLYGFASRVEKEIFLTLLSVKGIGPRGATGILSQSDALRLAQAIARGDKAFLSALKGVGKKTAERMVLELSEKVRDKMDAGQLAAEFGSGARAAPVEEFSEEMDFISDARAALIGLGYREQDIATALSRVLAEATVPLKRAEEVVRTALRHLS